MIIMLAAMVTVLGGAMFDNANPIKLSVILVIAATLLFGSMWVFTGKTWFPLLFFLIFTGGILMMFMMLSAVMPNESVKKLKLSSGAGILAVMLALLSVDGLVQSEVTANAVGMKSLMSAPWSMALLTMLILGYFSCAVMMLSSEKTAMRAWLCLEKFNFVNWSNKEAMKIVRKEEKMIQVVNNSLWDLPSPSTMTYFWNFGSTLGLCLVIQILTGLFLTFHYTSFAEESFSSVVMIMREVWGGWVVRFVHMNGASVFFFFIYLHLFRGLFYMSAVHKKVWVSGVTIMILLMAISFLGYVLPWGQMSYWAVAVITNLLSVIPLVGSEVVNWVWGGFSVGMPTLTRFYSLHFLLPFILMFATIVHLATLHKEGSSNSMGINSNIDKIEFHPYFSVKDLVFIMGVILVSLSISFYYPYILGDSVNNVPANSMQTPVHIQPEWYFLPSYAILRALPSKTAGVLALALSVSIFYILPLYSMKFSMKFNWLRYLNFWILIASFVFLMKMGAMPAEEPYVTISKWAGMVYFASILTLNM